MYFSFLGITVNLKQHGLVWKFQWLFRASGFIWGMFTGSMREQTQPSSHKLFFYHKWPDWWSFHMLSKKFVLLRKQTCFSLNSLLVISPKTFQASFFLLLLKWSVKSVNQSGIYSDTNLEFNVWLHHVHCLLCIVSEECASLMRLIDWTNMALMEFYKAIAIDA